MEREFLIATIKQATANHTTTAAEAIERLLCERVLANANVHAEALNLCKSVTSQLLSAESTKRESVAFIKSVLDRPSLHAHLSQALIEVLKQSFYPRWFVSYVNNNGGILAKSIKSCLVA